ncbi:hypothetical protein HYC85_014516 [Camellia sinensis]|uniref:Uncharacterized protein n=1 Tax=Camellia sinensis TaxID=4442 RepID=A0A7J7H6R2_CAMSI|nr:hypothetical protein HYC85_014516 [Camellia sinensis]
MLGIYLQRSTILLVSTGIFITLIYIFTKPILKLIGQSNEITSAAALFVHGPIPQIFAYTVNFPIQKFLQAQSVVLPSALISGATFVLHILLTWQLLSLHSAMALAMPSWMVTSWPELYQNSVHFLPSPSSSMESSPLSGKKESQQAVNIATNAPSVLT